jgi:ligand-binding sensor domain-containing protein
MDNRLIPLRTFIAILLCIGFFPCLFTSIAQPYPRGLYFSTVNQKLPRSFDRTYEDSRGFLWFCTGGGLCRYDGSEVRLYKADIDEANALSSSHIRDITEDHEGKLWITTKRGLNSFDPATGNFQTYFTDAQDTASLPGNWPKHITTDADGLLWMGFNDAAALACFDPLSGKSKRFSVRKGQPGQLQGSVVGKVVADTGRVYLGTTAGFEYYDKVSERFHFLPLLDERGDTVYYRLEALCKGRDGKIWMNMPGQGLRVYDPNKDSVYVFKPPVVNGGAIPTVEGVVEGKDGRLWLLNWPGLWSVSPDRQVVQKHSIKFLDHHPERGHEELHRNLYVDRYGLLRIGPHYYDPRGEIFEHHQVFKAGDPNPQFVTAIQEVNDSMLIVFIRGRSLWYNTRTRKNWPFIIPSPLPMEESGFQPGAPNWVWVTIDGVMHAYHVPQHKAYRMALEKDGSPFKINFMELAFDQEENIWISTWGQGLIRVPKTSWSHATGPIREFDQWLPNSPDPTVPSPNLLGVTVDSRNDVWVTCNVGGVTRINANDMTFRSYDYENGANTVSDTYTFKVVEGQDNAIWITTNASGLNKYDPETDRFTIYNRRKGMLDEDLFNIGVDREGHLWMNTNAGLTAFDPLTETFIDYDERDGLLSWRSNGVVSQKTNRLLWGGRQGFTIAQIDKLKKTGLRMPLILS